MFIPNTPLLAFAEPYSDMSSYLFYKIILSIKYLTTNFSGDADTLFDTLQTGEVQLQVRNGFNKEKIKSLGCWADQRDRAISGGSRKIERSSGDPIEDCYNFAKEHRYPVFAIQYNTECRTATDAADTYKKYGESDRCREGRGGSWANSVYEIIGE